MDLEQVNDDGIDVLSIWIDICDNKPLDEFISFAKTYDIFQIPRTKIYSRMVDRIKARLDREGLDYEIVRPE